MGIIKSGSESFVPSISRKEIFTLLRKFLQIRVIKEMR
jgi:hypothetical protein